MLGSQAPTALIVVIVKKPLAASRPCSVYSYSLSTYSQPQPRSSNQMRITGETNAADNMPRSQLSVDEVANALSFLTLGEIMPLRRVNMTWKDAAKETIVPLTDFLVNSERRYNAMSMMARALPNLQQITLGPLGQGHKWSDGDDPNEDVAAETADYTAHDIEIISNFSKLRILDIFAPLNGRYPVFFSFPLLQKLNIPHCYNLKWDLEMLAGMPLLKELYCSDNRPLTGNISSLRVLKDTLEKVIVNCCPNIVGNLMDLADFPHLKELDLDDTAVTGDIRDIGNNDFSSLEELDLPHGVYGGMGYEFQRISDGPDLVRALYLLKKQHPALSKTEYWYAVLSDDSPDWYESVEEDEDADSSPFYICFVNAGSRIGYRWTTHRNRPCEVNWLDPEPDPESNDYEEYIEELQEINSEVTFCRGFHQPPTREEYNRLLGLV